MPKVTQLKPQKNKKRINVYLDESGIIRKTGASVYCLTVVNSKFSEELDKKVTDIEKKLRILPFHWREQSWKLKSKFLEEVIKIQNWYCIIVVINNKHFSQDLLSELLAKAVSGFNIQILYFEGKKSRAYRNSVKKSLKTLGVKMLALKFAGNKLHGGLRISDAVAGLVRLHYDKELKSEAAKYYKLLLKNKISAQIVNGY